MRISKLLVSVALAVGAIGSANAFDVLPPVFIPPSDGDPDPTCIPPTEAEGGAGDQFYICDYDDSAPSEPSDDPSGGEGDSGE